MHIPQLAKNKPVAVSSQTAVVPSPKAELTADTGPNPITKAFRAGFNSGRRGSRDGYQGGTITRQNESWLPGNNSADSEIFGAQYLLMARARWLGRNNPWCVKAKNVFLNNVLGIRMATKATVRSESGTPQKEFNKQADKLYEDWVEDEADAAGRSTFDDLVRLLFESCIESGNAFLVEVTPTGDRDRKIPIAYQVLEYDYLDQSMDRAGDDKENRIVGGIEMDEFGRRIGYWFYTENPSDIYSRMRLESKFVAAERVIHLFWPSRPNQTVGVSWFSPIVTALWDTYEYQRHEINSAKVASFFLYMWKHVYDDNGLTSSGDPHGDCDENPEDLLGPGMGIHGGKDDSFEIIQSNRAPGQALPWLKLMLMTIASGLNLTYLALTSDYESTSFSSARAAGLQDRSTFRPIQSWLARLVHLKVRAKVTRQMIAQGLLKVPSGGLARFNRDPKMWLSARAQPKGWEYMDPDKETKADALANEKLLDTLPSVLARKGKNMEDHIEEIQATIDAFTDAGLEDLLPNIFGKEEPDPAEAAVAAGNGAEEEEEDEPPEDESDEQNPQQGEDE